MGIEGAGAGIGDDWFEWWWCGRALYLATNWRTPDGLVPHCSVARWRVFMAGSWKPGPGLCFACLTWTWARMLRSGSFQVQGLGARESLILTPTSTYISIVYTFITTSLLSHYYMSGVSNWLRLSRGWSNHQKPNFEYDYATFFAFPLTDSAKHVFECHEDLHMYQ